MNGWTSWVSRAGTRLRLGAARRKALFEQQDDHESQRPAIVGVAENIGCTAEFLRKWVRTEERQQIPEQQALDAEREPLIARAVR